MIVDARLELVLVYGDPQERQLTVHRVQSPWDEQGVSWQAAQEGQPWPIVGGHFDRVFAAVVSVPPSVEVGSIVEWDVTEEVRDLRDDNIPNFGWMVRDWAAVDQRALIEFASREATNRMSRPVLRVVVDACGQSN